MVSAEHAHAPVDYASAFALIAEMARGFAASGRVETTLLQALTSIASLVGAEAGSLWVVDASGTTLICRASVGPISITGARLSVSEGIVGKSVRENICLTVLDTARDSNFSPSMDQASGMVTRSILCAPMSFSDEVLGAVELINKGSGDGCFTEADAQLLRILASSAGLAICNQRLAAAQIETERMRREIELAAEIQASMLPLVFPPFPDRDEFSIFATLRPAREVGGDFYDFLLVDDHRLCFYVGDVSGKGMPSALFMAAAAMLIKSIARSEASPAHIMTRLNDDLSRNNQSCMFVTIFFGSLDLRNGACVYTNAGHNPPYLKRADGSIERLAHRHGPAVGATGAIAYGQSTIQLSTGDLLLLYTDGVTEATDPDEHFFSEERLADLLSARAFASVEDVVRSTSAAVEAFESGSAQADDVTILALRFQGQQLGTDRGTLKMAARNRLSEIRRVNESFNQFAEHHRVPPALRPRIELVFDELLTNIIAYAFRDDQEHTIDIEVEIADRRLVITISDDGIPFNPFDHRAPDTGVSLEHRDVGGLGIHLARNMMDEVSYERRADRNIVKLVQFLNDAR